MVTIYVELLNEGTAVWRSVDAVHLGGDSYRIKGATPPDEEWRFAPGDVVRCELKDSTSSEARMTAVAIA
jgi:hypothetical protein